jgi:hypothetical protein
MNKVMLIKIDSERIYLFEVLEMLYVFSVFFSIDERMKCGKFIKSISNVENISTEWISIVDDWIFIQLQIIKFTWQNEQTLFILKLHPKRFPDFQWYLFLT